MTMLTDLVSDIKAIPIVSSSVGSSVYPVIGKDKKPSIVYTIRRDHPTYTYKNAIGFNNTIVTLNIYSSTYSQLDGLRRGIVSRYNGFSGVLNTDGTYISSCYATSTLEDFNNETKTYRQVLDIDITYRED